MKIPENGLKKFEIAHGGGSLNANQNLCSGIYPFQAGRQAVSTRVVYYTTVMPSEASV